MENEMNEKSDRSNWHLNEGIFEKRTLNLKKLNLLEDLEDLKREYLLKTKMLDQVEEYGPLRKKVIPELEA
jgi:hypothetical protein